MERVLGRMTPVEKAIFEKSMTPLIFGKPMTKVERPGDPNPETEVKVEESIPLADFTDAFVESSAVESTSQTLASMGYSEIHVLSMEEGEMISAAADLMRKELTYFVFFGSSDADLADDLRALNKVLVNTTNKDLLDFFQIAESGSKEEIYDFIQSLVVHIAPEASVIQKTIAKGRFSGEENGQVTRWLAGLARGEMSSLYIAIGNFFSFNSVPGEIKTRKNLSQSLIGKLQPLWNEFQANPANASKIQKELPFGGGTDASYSKAQMQKFVEQVLQAFPEINRADISGSNTLS